MASEWESCNSTKNILNQLVKTEFAKERLTAEFEYASWTPSSTYYI